MKLWKPFCGLTLAAVLAGCGAETQPGSSPEKHVHVAPHGGTGVELGEHEFSLEFVWDAPAGTLRAWVLDGHMQDFIRLPVESFEVLARLPAGEQTLDLKAVANPASGEKAGDTSQFEAQADWLKTAPACDAVLKKLSIRGKQYGNVSFRLEPMKSK